MGTVCCWDRWLCREREEGEGPGSLEAIKGLLEGSEMCSRIFDAGWVETIRSTCCLRKLDDWLLIEGAEYVHPKHEM